MRSENITQFLEELTPSQIREYKQRLQEYDQALRKEIKNYTTMKITEKNQQKNTSKEVNKCGGI